MLSLGVVSCTSRSLRDLFRNCSSRLLPRKIRNSIKITLAKIAIRSKIITTMRVVLIFSKIGRIMVRIVRFDWSLNDLLWTSCKLWLHLLSHIFYTTRKHYMSLFSGSMKLSVMVNYTTLVKYMQQSKERCKQTTSLSHVPGEPCSVLGSSSNVWKILWQTRSPLRSSSKIRNITPTFSSIAVRTISISMTASAL